MNSEQWLSIHINHKNHSSDKRSRSNAGLFFITVANAANFPDLDNMSPKIKNNAAHSGRFSTQKVVEAFFL